MFKKQLPFLGKLVSLIDLSTYEFFENKNADATSENCNFECVGYYNYSATARNFRDACTYSGTFSKNSEFFPGRRYAAAISSDSISQR